MRKSPPSLRVVSEPDPITRVVLEFEAAWQAGQPPPLERYRDRFGPEASSVGLAELIKADLQNRYRRGERPSARDYLDRFPALAAEDGRALSLIYEEFCLRAEVDGPVDASEFCRRYETWRDSLVSQLQYHRELSLAAEPTPSGPDFPEVGDRFADYDLVAFLGQGASADVFRARAIKLGGKEFVLKISLDRGSEPDILGKLDHPNIVPVHSSVVDPETGLRGLVMPYGSGQTLDRVLRRFQTRGLPRTARGLRDAVAPEGTATVPTDRSEAPGWAGFPASGPYSQAVAWLGMRLALALAHAHGRGFYHRDVKPDNILLTERDGPQILDFNLAHDASLADKAREAHRGGTLPYMAREHLDAFLDPKRWKDVGPAADVFSLGLILRELLTGQVSWRPAAGLPVPRAIAALVSHRAAPQVPIRVLNRDVPHALAAIVARCLAESPDDRYPTAQALAEDLARCLDRRPLLIARNPSRVEATVNRARRNRSVLLVGLALILLGSIGGYLFVAGHRVSADSRVLIAQAVGPPGDLAAAAINKLVKQPDALDALALATDVNPGSIAIGRAYGEVLMKKGSLDEAAETYRRLLAIAPYDVLVYEAFIRLEVSRLCFDDAVRIADDGIARCLKAPADSDRAKVTTLQEFKVKTLVNQGDDFNDHKNFIAALGSFGRALEVLGFAAGREPPDAPDPSSRFVRHFYAASAYFGRMSASVRLGQLDRVEAEHRAALDQLEKARLVDPKAKIVARLGQLIKDLDESTKVVQ